MAKYPGLSNNQPFGSSPAEFGKYYTGSTKAKQLHRKQKQLSKQNRKR